MDRERDDRIDWVCLVPESVCRVLVCVAEDVGDGDWDEVPTDLVMVDVSEGVLERLAATDGVCEIVVCRDAFVVMYEVEVVNSMLFPVPDIEFVDDMDSECDSVALVETESDGDWVP